MSPLNSMKRSICVTPPDRGGWSKQRGVSLITAIFLITGLALLAALMTKLVVVGSEESIREWHSTQALFAAETGVEWAAFQIVQGHTPGGGCNPALTGSGVTPLEMVANRAWFQVAISCFQAETVSVYQITSNGLAGESSSSANARRQLTVQFNPEL